MKKILLFCLLLGCYTLHAQEDFNPENTVEKGILGDYTLKESFDWYEQNASKKVFRQDIKANPTKNDFNQLGVELKNVLPYDEYHPTPAIFYIFPGQADAIKLGGYLEYEDNTSAWMNLLVPNESLQKIKALPATTTVYAIDEGNNLVWYLLRFFNYPQEGSDTNKSYTIFSCNSGRIAYKCKPTKEELSVIGEEVYNMTAEKVAAKMGKTKPDTKNTFVADKQIIFSSATMQLTHGELSKRLGGKDQKEMNIPIVVSYSKTSNQYKIEVGEIPQSNLFARVYSGFKVTVDANTESVNHIRDMYEYKDINQEYTINMPEKIPYLFNSAIKNKYRKYQIFVFQGGLYYTINLYFSSKS